MRVVCPFGDEPQSASLPRFVDVVDGAPGVYSTTAGFAWNRRALVVVVWCVEPALDRGFPLTSTQLDWEHDYVEVFVDGIDCYYTVAVDRSNNWSETLYVWHDAYRSNPRFGVPELDLIDSDALIFEGDPDRSRSNYFSRRGEHPRGHRWAFRDWHLSGLTSSVAVADIRGSPNRQWIVRLALPWSALGWLVGEARGPRVGDTWRLHVGRHDRLEVSGGVVHAHSAAVPFGSGDRHHPERFVIVELGAETPDDRSDD
jgi:hypothetical protein